MKQIILIIILLSVTNYVISQVYPFKEKKIGYAIEFPGGYSKLSPKGAICYFNSTSKMGVKSNSNIVTRVYKREFHSLYNVYTKFDILYYKEYLGKKGKVANFCYQAHDQYYNTWLIENNENCILILFYNKNDFVDLSYVLPCLYSFRYPDGSMLSVTDVIAEEHYRYSENPILIGDGVSENLISILYEKNIKSDLLFPKNRKQLDNEVNFVSEQTEIVSKSTKAIASEKIEELNSEIDINIPYSTKENANSFAVIIGNENYDSEIAVSYAINDAQTFYKYVTKTMGVPEEQVHLITNATYGKMLREIQWINSVAQAFDGDASIIFYYAGHGMPDQQTKESYLLPVDGDASESVTAVSLDKVYAKLNEYPTKQATVFLDACFSGAARDGMLASGRGVRIVPKEKKPDGNLVVFSAVSGDQTAHPYESKLHGLFSYYLMKKLQETSGEISYGELSEYIKKEVNRKSVINGNAQIPQVNVSHNIQESWKEWKFK